MKKKSYLIRLYKYMGWSAACDRGIFWSDSLTFLPYKLFVFENDQDIKGIMYLVCTRILQYYANRF